MDSVDDFCDFNEDAFEEIEQQLRTNPWAIYGEQLEIIEAHADEIEKALQEHEAAMDEQIAFIDAHAEEIEKALQEQKKGENND